MKKLLVVLVVMMILASVMVASASTVEVETGSDLVAYYKLYNNPDRDSLSDLEKWKYMYISGYLWGVVTTLGHAGKVSIPADVNMAQINAVLEKQLNANPEWWNYSSLVIIHVVLSEVWPPQP